MRYSEIFLQKIEVLPLDKNKIKTKETHKHLYNAWITETGMKGQTYTKSTPM